MELHTHASEQTIGACMEKRYIASYVRSVCQHTYLHSEQKSGGFIAAVSGQLIVFGSYSSAMSPGICAESVEQLGEL